LNWDAGSRAVNFSAAEKRAVRKPDLDRRMWAKLAPIAIPGDGQDRSDSAIELLTEQSG
jgi:hypothetical protein